MADAEFGKKLGFLRKKAGFTQKQIAEILEIPNPSTVASWEIGKSEPSAATLMRLCVLYKVENILDAFGYGSSEKKEPPTEVEGETYEDIYNETTQLLAQLTDDERAAAMDYLRYLVSKRNVKNHEPPATHQ